MLADLVGAFAFLTALPVRGHSIGEPGRLYSYFPLVSLVIGAIVSLVASLSFLPPDVTAFLALVVWVGLTGGLHLDGFADSCDGLLATAPPARRVEIMHDSRAGAWAVVGLVLLLLGKWIALRSVEPILLILPPVAGRWALVLAAWGFPVVRSSGMGAHFRQGLSRAQVAVATCTVCVIGLLYGWPKGLVLITAPLAVLLVGRWAAARLGGGLTGDVYGALCELTELVCLIVLTLL
jgi:adenosylcobinamide-GDP ribazoletransferase